MSKLFNVFNNARNIALDMVDNQFDFIAEEGALSVNRKYGCKENASEVVGPTNRFLRLLPAGVIDFALIKFDTHFANEYPHSPESKVFPNPHCLFGQPGWDLAVNIAPLATKAPTYMLAKNEFDMWGTNPTGVAREKIEFTPRERQAYDNLFSVIPFAPTDNAADTLVRGTNSRPREAFMDTQQVGRGTVVILHGVASDVCDSFAIAGYLDRGATVVVAENLTRGIGAPTTAAPKTGSMAEVVDEHFARTHPQAVAEGRLLRAHSTEVLRALRQVKRQRAQPALAAVS